MAQKSLMVRVFCALMNWGDICLILTEQFNFDFNFEQLGCKCITSTTWVQCELNGKTSLNYCLNISFFFLGGGGGGRGRCMIELSLWFMESYQHYLYQGQWIYFQVKWY